MNQRRYIGPTPERLAKAGRNVEPVASDNGYETIRMLDGSPLEQLATIGKRNPRKGITGDQYHAGCRYYGDFYTAGLEASGVIDPAAVRVDGGEHKELPAFRLEAAARFHAALRAIDKASVAILSDVVLREKGINWYAERFRLFREARERRAIALNQLRFALDQLDRHYYPQRKDRIRSSLIVDNLAETS